MIGITTAEDESNRVESLAETRSLQLSDPKAIPVPAVDWCCVMYDGDFPYFYPRIVVPCI